MSAKHEMNDATAMISDQLTAIDAKVTALENRFAPIADKAARAIDKRFESGLMPIIRCIDTIKELRSEPEAESDRRLEIVANELESVLESLGIERFQLEMPDPTKQRTLDVRDTDDKERDGTIAKSLRDGYVQGNRVIRQQYVILYKYRGASV
jgi:molecular chaperone GrpE (heat shock protein)